MIDNFNIFAPWFDNLSDQGDFYFVQVIQRKKECDIGSNNNVIKDYHFFDKKSFLNKKEEIVTLCKTFNARAYFWINPRNCKQVQYEIIRETLEAIECNSKKLFKCVSKSIGQRRNTNYKSKWVLDFDTKDWNLINKYLGLVRECRPYTNIILYYVPTVNGIHVITLGFDLGQFKQKVAIAKLDNIDIHKDNPSVLYYDDITRASDNLNNTVKIDKNTLLKLIRNSEKLSTLEEWGVDNWINYGEAMQYLDDSPDEVLLRQYLDD